MIQEPDQAQEAVSGELSAEISQDKPLVCLPTNEKLKLKRLVYKTGRPTIFTSSKWLSNPRNVFEVELDFLKQYNQYSKGKETLEADHILHQKILKESRKGTVGTRSDKEGNQTNEGKLPEIVIDAAQPKTNKKAFMTYDTSRSVKNSHLKKSQETPTGAKKDPFISVANEKRSLGAVGRYKTTGMGMKNSNTFGHHRRQISETPADPSWRGHNSNHIGHQRHATTLEGMSNFRQSNYPTNHRNNPSEDNNLSFDGEEEENYEERSPKRTIKKGNFRLTQSEKKRKERQLERQSQKISLLHRLVPLSNKGTSNPFEAFNILDRELEKKGWKVERPKRKILNKEIFENNRKLSSLWPIVSRERLTQQAAIRQQKTELARFEKEKKEVAKKLVLLIKSGTWDLGSNITAVVREMQEVKAEKQHKIAPWMTVFLLFLSFLKMKETVVLYKVCERFRNAKKPDICRFINIAKEISRTKLVPEKRYRRDKIVSNGMQLFGKMYQDIAVAKSRRLVGTLFVNVFQRLNLKHCILYSHSLLKDMAQNCLLFYKKIQLFKGFVRSVWEEAKEETLGTDRISSNAKLILTFEDQIIKFIYDYFYCSRVTDTMELVQLQSDEAHRKFSAQALHASLMRPEVKVILDIVLDCMVESMKRCASNASEKKGKNKNKGLLSKESSSLNTPSESRLPSMTSLSSKIVFPALVQALKEKKNSSQPKEKLFLPFNLLRHVDVKMMANIQQQMIDKYVYIRSNLPTKYFKPPKNE